MIVFDKFTLENGLKVIVHQDKTTPIVAFNLLYDVGAKDESPDKTGFAHLFEHLMFGGSVNIPSFDKPLQEVGGENNAFTSNDLTNYYITLPKENLETAFWLESDRMLCLDFSEKNLEVQRNVVIEEFKQRYLNQPYGDIWLNVRPLAYKTHPYQWPTIGKDISHIENANLSDVKDFFYSHYGPNNAILCVSGDVTTQQIKELSNKWFGPIERRNIVKRNLPVEQKQTAARFLSIERPVPYDSIFKVYHMCAKTHSDYFASDLVSDILSNGNSSRLYQHLVKEKQMFGEINSYILGSHDPGLLIVSGKLNKGVELKEADEAIKTEMNYMFSKPLEENELNKVKNKVEANLVFSKMSVLNKAMNLCFCELLGDASDYNKEEEQYQSVTPVQLMNTAKEILTEENSSTLYYKATSN